MREKTAKMIEKSGGFTLIEVLMAMAVFSIGFLALAAMQITATNGNTQARGLMDAVSVLEDHMEYLKNLPNDQQFIANNGGNRHPDLQNTGTAPNEIDVRDLDTDGVGGEDESRRFNGTIRWWVWDSTQPDTDAVNGDNDGMPATPDYPSNAIKIRVEVQWVGLMRHRSIDYTFVRVSGIM